MTDSYGRQINYLRLSVTERCNLRCCYCMPEKEMKEREQEALLTQEEIILAVKAAAFLGVKKVRITGGEPLMKKNIVSLCQQVAEVDGVEEVCMTTNGIFLPRLAKPLLEAGVKRVNISLDTLQEEKYRKLTRGGKLADVWKGLEAALAAGFTKVKINTVLIGGVNDEEIQALAALTLTYPVDVRFIELMPMYDGGEYGAKAFLPASIVGERLSGLLPVEPDGGVAKLYRFPWGKGNIGVISPVNMHFCASCTRLRLTADGQLKPCLHSAEEFSLKGMDFWGMVEQMKRAIWAKPASHGTLSYSERSKAGRNMNQIGG